jgi:branched-chain amino acid transport system substrate-binding protein
MKNTTFKHLCHWVLGGLLSASVLAVNAQTGADIVIGQVAPFTNIPVTEALEINQGATSYLAQLNKSGVQGRKVVLFKMDDEYNADKFVERFASAMEKRPVALISPIGSTAIKRMLDDKLLDSADVVVMNAIPGAESLRNPGHRKLFHVRAGDKQQIEKIVNHARTIGITKLSMLYQDFAMGISGEAVAQTESARVTGLAFKSVKSATDEKSLTQAATELAAQSPQGILIVGAPRFSVDGVAALRKAGVTQSIFVLSYVQPGLLIKVAGLAGARGVGIAQTYPNPNGRVLPLLREFQAAMKVSFPDIKEYTPFHLEGYMSAKVVGEALLRSKDITGAGLARSLKAMGEIDLGGFRVDFSKANTGSNFVDIGVMNIDGRLVY